MPLLPGWIVVETPQPIVQINRLTVEVPCKKSKLASAEQPNQVASDVLAEPISIESELVSAMLARGGGELSKMNPVNKSWEYGIGGERSSGNKNKRPKKSKAVKKKRNKNCNQQGLSLDK